LIGNIRNIQIYVKFLTEEDLRDNVKITEKFSKFYKIGCPGFLSIEIFRDDLIYQYKLLIFF
jgi:hypothetical protein